MSGPVTANYGGGVNSTAMIVGMHEHGIRPNLITYCDPGKWLEEPAEKPETYRYIEIFSGWCESVGLPPVTVVRHKSDTLYASCIRNGTLPSKAYGFPGCSVKFKHQIIEAYETEVFGPDQIITKAIGYHADEDRGSSITEKGRYRYRYFLKEWGWGQHGCIEALKRHGLPIPMKSSCYFCPSMKPQEIRWLHKHHPELFARAVGMEHSAEPYHREGGGVTKGLGRSWSWESLIAADEAQFDLFPEPPEINCMCFDGEGVEDAV
jgi:hypothetical protein